MTERSQVMLMKLLWVIKNKKTSSLIIPFIIFNFLLTGCASKTLIKSRPDGAEVYIDNVKQGKTPLNYEDTAIAGSTKQLKLRLEGYEDFATVIISVRLIENSHVRKQILTDN